MRDAHHVEPLRLERRPSCVEEIIPEQAPVILPVIAEGQSFEHMAMDAMSSARESVRAGTAVVALGDAESGDRPKRQAQEAEIA